jgi:hypothetical protein
MLAISSSTAASPVSTRRSIAPIASSIRGDRRRDRSLVGHVEVDRCDAFDVDEGAIRSDDRASLLDERQADLPANSMRRPGNERDLALEPVKLLPQTSPSVVAVSLRTRRGSRRVTICRVRTEQRQTAGRVHAPTNGCHPDRIVRSTPNGWPWLYGHN